MRLFRLIFFAIGVGEFADYGEWGYTNSNRRVGRRFNRWGFAPSGALNGVCFMRIASSEIGFAAQHMEVSRLTRKETMTERIRPAEETPAARLSLRAMDDRERVSLMSHLAQPVQPKRTPEAKSTEGVAPVNLELSAEDRARIDMIVAALEQISGKKIALIDPETALKKAYATPDVEALSAVQEMRGQTQAEAPPVREVHYRLEETYFEAESTAFQAKGLVKTADGQEIEIDVSLSMSRAFMRAFEIDVVTEQAVTDPLVINFEGTAAQLTQRTYAFDLDMNGTEDQIHFVGAGSGFLALDRNGDGMINDGSELFGPRTGNGFVELAEHDEDGNGWIDEGDSIYGHLRIWTKDAEGHDSLLALGHHGIGAIYLGHAATPFQVKDAQNQLQGIVRSSGVYLNQNGTAGTVQQVDLVV